MAKKHSFIRVMLCLVLLFALIFSVFYVATEADHDCAGECCAICRQIAQCEEFLHVALSLVTVALFTLGKGLLSSFRTLVYAGIEGEKTPVARKVKLSD